MLHIPYTNEISPASPSASDGYAPESITPPPPAPLLASVGPVARAPTTQQFVYTPPAYSDSDSDDDDPFANYVRPPDWSSDSRKPPGDASSLDVGYWYGDLAESTPSSSSDDVAPWGANGAPAAGNATPQNAAVGHMGDQAAAATGPGASGLESRSAAGDTAHALPPGPCLSESSSHSSASSDVDDDPFANPRRRRRTRPPVNLVLPARLPRPSSLGAAAPSAAPVGAAVPATSPPPLEPGAAQSPSKSSGGADAEPQRQVPRAEAGQLDQGSERDAPPEPPRSGEQEGSALSPSRRTSHSSADSDPFAGYTPPAPPADESSEASEGLGREEQPTAEAAVAAAEAYGVQVTADSMALLLLREGNGDAGVRDGPEPVQGTEGPRRPSTAGGAGGGAEREEAAAAPEKAQQQEDGTGSQTEVAAGAGAPPEGQQQEQEDTGPQLEPETGAGTPLGSGHSEDGAAALPVAAPEPQARAEVAIGDDGPQALPDTDGDAGGPAGTSAEAVLGGGGLWAPTPGGSLETAGGGGEDEQREEHAAPEQSQGSRTSTAGSAEAAVKREERAAEVVEKVRGQAEGFEAVGSVVAAGRENCAGVGATDRGDGVGTTAEDAGAVTPPPAAADPASPAFGETLPGGSLEEGAGGTDPPSESLDAPVGEQNVKAPDQGEGAVQEESTELGFAAGTPTAAGPAAAAATASTGTGAEYGAEEAQPGDSAVPASDVVAESPFSAAAAQMEWYSREGAAKVAPSRTSRSKDAKEPRPAAVARGPAAAAASAPSGGGAAAEAAPSVTTGDVAGVVGTAPVPVEADASSCTGSVVVASSSGRDRPRDAPRQDASEVGTVVSGSNMTDAGGRSDVDATATAAALPPETAGASPPAQVETEPPSQANESSKAEEAPPVLSGTGCAAVKVLRRRSSQPGTSTYSESIVSSSSRAAAAAAPAGAGDGSRRVVVPGAADPAEPSPPASQRTQLASPRRRKGRPPAAAAASNAHSDGDGEGGEGALTPGGLSSTTQMVVITAVAAAVAALAAATASEDGSSCRPRNRARTTEVSGNGGAGAPASAAPEHPAGFAGPAGSGPQAAKRSGSQRMQTRQVRKALRLATGLPVAQPASLPPQPPQAPALSAPQPSAEASASTTTARSTPAAAAAAAAANVVPALPPASSSNAGSPSPRGPPLPPPSHLSSSPSASGPASGHQHTDLLACPATRHRPLHTGSEPQTPDEAFGDPGCGSAGTAGATAGQDVSEPLAVTPSGRQHRGTPPSDSDSGLLLELASPPRSRPRDQASRRHPNGLPQRRTTGPLPGMPFLRELASRYPVRRAPANSPQVALVSGQLFVCERLRTAMRDRQATTGREGESGVRRTCSSNGGAVGSGGGGGGAGGANAGSARLVGGGGGGAPGGAALAWRRTVSGTGTGAQSDLGAGPFSGAGGPSTAFAPPPAPHEWHATAVTMSRMRSLAAGPGVGSYLERRRAEKAERARLAAQRQPHAVSRADSGPAFSSAVAWGSPSCSDAQQLRSAAAAAAPAGLAVAYAAGHAAGQGLGSLGSQTLSQVGWPGAGAAPSPVVRAQERRESVERWLAGHGNEGPRRAGQASSRAVSEAECSAPYTGPVANWSFGIRGGTQQAVGVVPQPVSAGLGGRPGGLERGGSMGGGGGSRPMPEAPQARRGGLPLAAWGG